MLCINITDFDDWRVQARELLKREITPADIDWKYSAQGSLFDDQQANLSSLEIRHSELRIPREFLPLAKDVSCHRDDHRWSLLYSVAWRLIFENRSLLDFRIEEQISRLLAMQKSVSRDRHKMKAFVRFRKINQRSDATPLAAESDVNNQDELYIAWFEPEHLIVPSLTSFFIKRFNNMRWSILTPDICAHWNCEQLTYSEGLAHPPRTQDNLEELWRTYYANIFNPARLKLKAMQSEMPKKYWVNLPEAPLIKELTRNSSANAEKMIERRASTPWKKTEKSQYIKRKSQLLRSR